jgi:DNA modification methylase
MNYTLHNMDCIEAMRNMEENSIDSIVCDPPYGLSFMGKGWDHGTPGIPFWAEALRVAKPGAYLLAFGGTRTYHRLACAIEDAGWEIRDCIMWVYSTGFPKSTDVSKQIDKKFGAERKVVGEYTRPDGTQRHNVEKWEPQDWQGYKVKTNSITTPATEAAKQWQGWGSALKPAWEPIVMARKPFKGTIAENVLKHGTGAINVDGCRVGTEERTNKGMSSLGVMHDDEWKPKDITTSSVGRWPANLILTPDKEVLACFPDTGASKATNRGLQHSGRHGGLADAGGNIKPGTDTIRGHDDNGGSAARFFHQCPYDTEDVENYKRLMYCAKTSKTDRSEGCEALEEKQYSHDGREKPIENAYQRNNSKAQNVHPCLKPTPLLRNLVRLVTPPGGTVLDPFAGSGSTGKAAILEGFNFIGCELEEEYAVIAKARLEHAARQMEGRLL